MNSMLKKLEYAKKIPIKNTMKHTHICMIMIGKKIISIGFNSNKTSIKINGDKYKIPTCHAEIEAISKIKNKKNSKKKYDLYIIRIKNESFKNSKPCLNCITYIKNLGYIKRIIYTTGDEDVYNIQKINNIELKEFLKSSGWKYYYNNL